MSDGTTLGPVEIAVIGFAGNKFTGEVAPALADLIESGTVSILDLVFVTKDADGSVTAIELSDLDDDVAAPYKDLDGSAGGLLSDEDFEQVGDALEAEQLGAGDRVGEHLGAQVHRRRARRRRLPRRPRPRRRGHGRRRPRRGLTPAPIWVRNVSFEDLGANRFGFRDDARPDELLGCGEVEEHG